MTATADLAPRTTADAEPVATERPRWMWPALLALLGATAVLYLWGLGSAGWANQYYAAAAQAGTQDWKAWLFGSLDAGNAITVDKPPAALWVMALSGRLFGFSPFTMLLPQALMGVASVAVLFAAVRRVSGPGAGLIAGAALAVTPVAALMFRYNNPDALLVLLLVVAAYLTVRAIQTGGTRWMVLVGIVLGFAFLTKMLQAFLVMPGLALAFLVAAPVGLWRRIGTLLTGALAMVATAGSFLAMVSLWPADSRPYIGGSTDNSLLQLALGYNGIQRVMGGEGGPGGGAGAPPGGPGGPGGGANLFFGGDPGLGRLFGASMGAEASWLLPAALIGLVAGLWFTRRAPRTCAVRASLLLWGGWVLVTGVVFSFMDGIIHPYYTVALAPGIAALIGICVVELWRGRRHFAPRTTLAVMSAGTGVWAFILLDRTPDWQPWLRWVVLIGSIVAAAVIAVGAHRLGRATAAVAAAAILFGAAAPAAYAIETAGNAHDGPVAMSGPARTDVDLGGPPGPGGPGGPGASVADNTELQHLVQATDSRWAAASVGSMVAGELELQTGTSVMAIGGFTGGDNSPTLQQFQDYVADRQVRYFIAGGHGGPGRNSGSAGDITAWVEQNFAPMDVGGTTVYDLQR
ncbi:glycosyltransferase family 39 protein [Mycolicibacterium austroafricanum]|uniref:Glycosyltransferase family 39 protein n=1 Tax=Mycolicibacterium austroafricanum TaxID=39687 RepID=A0ABT8HL62_MYCAO|nr:glycosyltransferase family 39 protein [Mycolicibacterium austroafricanum]MDN4521503.1 glycosyltransferase family 39 protein [Mycolicibacterium austroafricanum]QRZ05484.1 glycosyltransferase family 39 protein [Mycolicibacterium austroafricanum]QZT67045.1 glycosyltransferase family 39 protein [Mycolicibacterium austroafricanum]